MKRLTPLTLALALAACGTVQSDNGNNVVVSANTSTITLASDGTSESSTAYTFTNPAGAKPTSVTSATVSWGTGAEQSKTVTIPAVSLPAGLTCAAAATNPSAVCDYNVTGTTFGARSLTASISDSTLFASAYAANPSAKNLPVTVTFNGAANAVNFVLSIGSASNSGGTTPVENPQPLVTVNSSASQPYSGTLNVTVAGNFDAASTVQSVILEVTDINGAVDNTTYTSTQSTATFSVDTTKFPDGKLSLRAIALTRDGLRGESAVQNVTIQNIAYPTITIPSPASGTTVTTSTLPIQINITKRNTAFTIPGGSITVDLLDYRGELEATRTISGVADNANGTYSTTFDVASLPADTYTVRVRTPVLLSGNTSAQTVETVSQVTTNTTSQNPPAAVIRFPVALPNTVNPSSPTPAVINSASGMLVQVSDNTGVDYIQVRLVRPDGTPLNAYLLNMGFDSPKPLGPLDVVLNSLDIDGSQYVPNGTYTMRVTVADVDGNRNIQEIPVKVDRAVTISGLSTNSSTNPNTPNTAAGQLTYSSGTWTITGLPTTFNPNLSATTRVSAVLSVNGVTSGSQFFILNGESNASVAFGFSEAGVYRVDWIVEDLSTGAIRYVPGQAVAVVKNPT